MTGAHVERRHSLVPDFDTWFGREFPGLPGWRPATAAHSIPVEVTSGDGCSVLRAELPGMDPDDITLTVDDNLLTVRAEHGESTEDKDHSEFRYGVFRRTVRFPDPIPADDVEASYADGILTVRVPTPAREARAARTIPVRRAGAGGDGEDRS
ncbi:Hsp20/alpha crystallin family protein [Streptomyces roseofulvus]|uniref:Hsp20/alpha crystallin family protein n=2 Tax=Streptomyces TaxID=1883 RepID=A0ABU4KEV2_9ACTN|nr:Hsp20/alpha crystallin family protein [Streptomyces roseolus]MDX2296315.1 Hsp20/alpha crystallin family protein [Streptomyces roseolus]